MVQLCPVCGAPQQTPLFAERGHQLVSCDQCELAFVSPYPEPQAVYDTVAEYEYDSLEILAEDRHFRSSELFYADYYPKIVAELGQARSYLDVGCGTGYLLTQLAEFPQLRRVGIELNSGRAAYARRKSGCEILQIPLEKYEPAEPFDVVSIMNVLSHVPNVNHFLETLKRMLSPQGKLLVKIGEIARHVRADAIYDWQIPDHLQFLGLKTMAYLAERHGFRILRHERVPISAELFSRNRWMAPGRSSARNLVKSLVARTPGALAMLRRTYDWRHRQSIYSSFIVLQPR